MSYQLYLELSHGENTTTNSCEIANVFNNYFASVAEIGKQNINYSHKHFSEYLKHQILILLKQDISLQLADLFNLSFSSGSFPSIFKSAKVVSVFKKCSKLDCYNYSSISLLSNVEKIFCKILKKLMY